MPVYDRRIALVIRAADRVEYLPFLELDNAIQGLELHP
jgi:hypothetical protein